MKKKTKVISMINHPTCTRKDQSSSQMGYNLEEGALDTFRREMRPQPIELHNYKTLHNSIKKKDKWLTQTSTFEIDGFFRIKRDNNFKKTLRKIFCPLRNKKYYCADSQKIPQSQFDYVLFEVKSTPSFPKLDNFLDKIPTILKNENEINNTMANVFRLNIVFIHNGSDPVEFNQSMSEKGNVSIMKRKLEDLEKTFNCSANIFVVYLLQNGNAQYLREKLDKTEKEKDEEIEKNEKKDEQIEKLMALIPKKLRKHAIRIVESKTEEEIGIMENLSNFSFKEEDEIEKKEKKVPLLRKKINKKK